MRRAAGAPEEGGTVPERQARRAGVLAAERRELARRMKRRLGAEDLDAYYLEYDIDVASKRRKRRLTERLWAAEHTDAMHQLSSELVHRLLAPEGEDAEGCARRPPPLEDVVFGGPAA